MVIRDYEGRIHALRGSWTFAINREETLVLAESRDIKSPPLVLLSAQPERCRAAMEHLWEQARRDGFVDFFGF